MYLNGFRRFVDLLGTVLNPSAGATCPSVIADMYLRLIYGSILKA